MIANIPSPAVEPRWQWTHRYQAGDDLDWIEFDLSTENHPPGDYFVVVGTEVHVGDFVRPLPYHESLLTAPRYTSHRVGNQLAADVITLPRPGPLKVRYKQGTSLNEALQNP